MAHKKRYKHCGRVSQVISETGGGGLWGEQHGGLQQVPEEHIQLNIWHIKNGTNIVVGSLKPFLRQKEVDCEKNNRVDFSKYQKNLFNLTYGTSKKVKTLWSGLWSHFWDWRKWTVRRTTWWTSASPKRTYSIKHMANQKRYKNCGQVSQVIPETGTWLTTKSPTTI